MIRVLKGLLVCCICFSVNAQVEMKTIKMPGYRLVQYTYIDGGLYVMFEPSIARNDKALSEALVAIGEKVFAIKRGQLPIEDIVTTPKGNAIRHQYKKKSLIFLPIKNDDGTIHTVMVSEK